MNIKSLTLLMGIFLLTGCSASEKDYSMPLYNQLDVQGHRGCRGSLPENSIPGFIQALEWGVTTLEMDVVISKDHQVVLSHEPFLSHRICLDKNGNELDSASQFQYNMYEMSYNEIQQFDCGSKSPMGFKKQKPVPGPKPLLREVIMAVETRTTELNLTPVKYNIETKTMMGYDNVFHPPPDKFVELVLEVVEELSIEDRTIIQSFDPRTLQQARLQNPDITIALLIENLQGPLHNFIQLGFEPNIYSPEYHLVSDSLVRYLHSKNIALIPWTVNDSTAMKGLINVGVDGIITDYPEVLLKLLGRLE